MPREICHCVLCERSDEYMRRETLFAEESRYAQRRGDYDLAASADRMRRDLIDAARRCIERCKGGRS